jgi:small subunit ribosomal protein S20
LANHKAALKSIRQDAKRYARNRAINSRVKTAVKGVLKAVEGRQEQEARAALKTAICVVDKACTKGVLHKNNAARKKSRLMKKVNSLAA